MSRFPVGASQISSAAFIVLFQKASHNLKCKIYHQELAFIKTFINGWLQVIQIFYQWMIIVIPWEDTGQGQNTSEVWPQVNC